VMALTRWKIVPVLLPWTFSFDTCNPPTARQDGTWPTKGAVQYSIWRPAAIVYSNLQGVFALTTCTLQPSVPLHVRPLGDPVDQFDNDTIKKELTSTYSSISCVGYLCRWNVANLFLTSSQTSFTILKV